MPTINTTPVQVPSDGKSVQLSTQSAPFYVEIGSSLYQVLFSAQGTSPARTIGIFKRATASVGGPWTEMDAAGSPDQGNQSGYGVVSIKGTVITVAYLQVGQLNLRFAAYDTATDTWGSPSAIVVLPQSVFRFVFVQRSDNTYVVIAATTFRTYYLTNTAGVWSARTEILPSGGNIVAGVIDSADRIHYLFNIQTSGVGNGIEYRNLSPTFVLSSPQPIANTISPTDGGWPSIALWGAAHIAIGYTPTSGIGVGTVRVFVGTPLAAPLLVDTLVYTPAGVSERVAYVETAEGTDGSLNAFFVDTNFTLPVNQIMQAVFDGASAWSTSIFYDAIANPPINGATPVGSTAQVIRTLQGVQLATQGWTVATAMVTDDTANPPAQFNTGEFLEAASAPPEPPPSSDEITCQIIITGPPPGPGVGKVQHTLRYQIPQRRWFPHQYND